MKIRIGFVSNSSSASFVVEVKGEKEKIFNSLYKNIQSFQEEGYKKLLEQALKWDEDNLTRELTDTERKMTEYSIKEHKESLKMLAEYVKPEWGDILKIKDEKEKSFAIWKEKHHIEKVVKGVLRLERWYCSYIDDGYISFSDSTIVYDGWESISNRKTLVEMLAFFMFMKFEVRTRIESDLQ